MDQEPWLQLRSFSLVVQLKGIDVFGRRFLMSASFPEDNDIVKVVEKIIMDCFTKLERFV